MELPSDDPARVLAHPARVRIWTELGAGDATISQLAARLHLNKGSVSHHLRVLVGGGLVGPGATRTVRGGTEKYFTRTTRRVVVPHERGTGTAAQVMTREMLRELGSARSPHVHQRSVRLTPAQAEALVARLDEVLHRLPAADDRHPLFGVVTAVYRKG